MHLETIQILTIAKVVFFSLALYSTFMGACSIIAVFIKFQLRDIGSVSWGRVSWKLALLWTIFYALTLAV